MVVLRARRVVLGAALAALAIAGVVAGFAAREAIAHARVRATAGLEARGLTAQATAWQLAAEARRAGLGAVAPLLLDASTDAEAATGLDALLRTWSGLHGARVVSMEPLPGLVAAPLATVRVRARLDGPVESVLGVLEKVEYGPRLLSIEGLRLTLEPDGTIAGELTIAGWYAVSGQT